MRQRAIQPQFTAEPVVCFELERMYRALHTADDPGTKLPHDPLPRLAMEDRGSNRQMIMEVAAHLVVRIADALVLA